jgi:hypothetical protein
LVLHIRKLGWSENQKSFARQHLRLAIPNFAEVGFCCRHLILATSKKPRLYNLISEFRLSLTESAEMIRNSFRDVLDVLRSRRPATRWAHSGRVAGRRPVWFCSCRFRVL